MAPSYRVLPVILALLVLGAAASAQTTDSAVLTTAEAGSAVAITVTMDIDGSTFPPAWVGWVVDRTTIGRCEDTVTVGDVTPFPSGQQTFTLTDWDAEEGITYRYRLYAVDAEGTRAYLPGPPMFEPAYYHFDYESVGEGAVFEGALLAGGGGSYPLDVCGGQCWELLAFASGVPPELAAGAGTGVVVLIRGEIDAEFEGPYISRVDSWEITGSCGTVPEESPTWGELKARYR